MTDRELLELAARAGGYKYRQLNNAIIVDGIPSAWNPLTDDGDALRLAVKLGITVKPFLGGSCAVVTPSGWQRTEAGYENVEQATRRAITRAAAEIARQRATES